MKQQFKKLATNLRRDKLLGLTVRPELVEGWTVKPIMVRQGSAERSRRAHHERLNLSLSRLKLAVKKLLQPLLVLSLLLPPPLPTLAQSLEEQTVLAALALNIVRFNTWPAEAQIEDTIAFCVIGNNVVQQSFAGVDHKTVGNKIIQIINLSRLRNLEQCHALYISDLKQAVLLQLFAEIKKRPLLTIGENYEFAVQGGMVGMENIDGKITLHVNLPVTRESNLNISSRLLNLANIIGN